MSTLRIAAEAGRWTVEAGERRAFVPPPALLSPRDEEDARWYFEEFLEFPYDPAPAIAARVEARLSKIGEELFRTLFASAEALSVWNEVQERLSETRVEIDCASELSETVPWELLREPGSARPLTLTARSLVRIAAPQGVRSRFSPDSSIRILLVICRPGGSLDVPFRSVARHLIRAVETGSFAGTTVDVLRPPTFARLQSVLRSASRAHRPYHLVHFDGHGTYEQVHNNGIRRGYVLFENPSDRGNQQLVHGTELGGSLAKYGVGVLVLNACRSAHAEVRSAPDQSPSDQKAVAFGSLAREVAMAGVPGVVAMRYNVHVDTAAHFIGDMYARLARGALLSDAVSAGRHALAASPLREFSLSPQNLSDWAVPVLFEMRPVVLVRPGSEQSAPAPLSNSIDAALPPPPAHGFIGRDQTLLALDRAFDRSAVAMLISWAGDGKTATTGEFARWYQATGGVSPERVLYTSCKNQSLADLFSAFCRVFAPGLAIGWDGVSLDRRIDAVLRTLSGTRSLWIWDDVECISAGTPGGAPRWTIDERTELRRFFRGLQRTNAKILLVSRRPEDWIGIVPPREWMSPLSISDSARFIWSLANRAGLHASDLSHWTPLIVASAGCPLTLEVFIEDVLAALPVPAGQHEITRHVAQLCAGESACDRRERLHDSLGHWFPDAVPVGDRAWFSVLYWFRGFVSIFDLHVMGMKEMPWHVPELVALSENPDQAVRILSAACEAGLLRMVRPTYYAIHPGLASFLRQHFFAAFATPGDRERVARGYVGSCGDLSNHATNRILDGDRTPVTLLRFHERNLQHAWRLAIDRGWLNFAVDMMQGLEELYRERNQLAEWITFVDEIEPLVTRDGKPHPDWQSEWAIVQEHKQRLAIDRPGAVDSRTISASVSSHWRRSTDSILGKCPADLSSAERNALRSRAVALNEEGLVLMKTSDPKCMVLFEESMAVAERIADVYSALRTKMNIAIAYTAVEAIVDYRRADEILVGVINDLQSQPDRKDLTDAVLTLGRSRVEFLNVQARAGKPGAELTLIYRSATEALNLASQFIQETGTPLNSGRLAFLSAELLTITQRFEDAVRKYQEAIKLLDGDPFHAAKARYSIAYCLDQLGKPDDARNYREEGQRIAAEAGFIITER